MVKIKGWDKRKDQYSPTVGKIERWDNNKSSVSVSVVTDDKIARWWLHDVFGYSEEMGASRDKEFIKKSAIKYMRSHPNG